MLFEFQRFCDQKSRETAASWNGCTKNRRHEAISVAGNDRRRQDRSMIRQLLRVRGGESDVFRNEALAKKGNAYFSNSFSSDDETNLSGGRRGRGSFHGEKERRYFARSYL